MEEKILYLDSATFDEAISGSGLILVDFWAKWCGPCKMLAPVLEEVANEAVDITIAKVDIDECEDIAMRFGVMSIPTLMIFKNSEIIAKTVGFKNKTQILAFIEENK